ncbi:MAG TPA: DNA-directed RNA polymerase subunit omega [Spirochaetaceae bacterium]|nr:DNA-directed RNA polymerase subunit omega [Spirochaetaceae bacterium]
MIIPLEELINYNTNSYELAVAVNRRAFQLAVLKTPEVEKCNGKVVSLAAQQVFSKQVEYRFISN